MPFPNITSDLAKKRHMYICQSRLNNNYKFVKCQSFKPYMLFNNPMKHYWDENSDNTRNPFTNPTRIDCDRIFTTTNILYDDKAKTSIRPDVCDDTITNIDRELKLGPCTITPINEDDLEMMNYPNVKKIK